ncbi:nitrate reductase [Favolaschia claudopus]|uniref:Nitrate reductase n=1 Tax=Favolaschia claudopus TaxID=2862362 RepID=A0AAW0D1M3_9AGAR
MPVKCSNETTQCTDISSASTIETCDGAVLPPPPQSNAPSETLEIDRGTPDAHVSRDSRMIRLTGVHPFNAEAPLTELFREGFLTTPELFFVRNHGVVPEVHDENVLDWEFTVDGMVETPLKITLQKLVAEYEQQTYPVTLVCAGNRRKEQNMVRKSKGFSWGPAGVSTALFTGVVMSDVVRRAKPRKGAKFVYMEGADKLPNGHYGTCVKLSWVLDPNRGIMLAYKMNGEMLRPDHGKPLRVVIPGQIGGRSVKWLKKLTITDQPSDNWYHIYDNRVLPTMISPEVAAEGSKWWTDERYAIHDLSPNSAIASPAHGERLRLLEGGDVYTARGYAYGGGGRRITRVEVSLDQGRTWRLARIQYVEDEYRKADRILYGGKLDFQWRDTSFCWCFWTLDIPVQEMSEAKDILVRCMDEGMCVQPRDVYWSVLGMMHNAWFRVAIMREADELRFEHPTQPALIPGGWMERVKAAGGDLTNGFWGEQISGLDAVRPAKPVHDVYMKKEGLHKHITFAELREHAVGKNLWFVVNSEVYDATEYLNEHPGGIQSIASAAATDATDEFMSIPDPSADSETAKAMMRRYHIGTLDDTAKKELSLDCQDEEANNPTVFLQPRSWSSVKLHARKSVSRDTRIFTFKLQHEDQILGLRTGQHIMVRLRDPATREAIVRCFTPISEIDKKGEVELLIKVYSPRKDYRGGAMSMAIDSLPIGHEVEFKGPIGKFEYHGRGEYSAGSGGRKKTERFLMICGGSGVTPIYQVFRAVMRDEQDATSCTVLDSNTTEEDILCREHLDELVREGGGRGEVIYTLTKGDEKWDGLRGRIDREMIQRYCPGSAGTVVLLSGPEEMEKDMRRFLEESGWQAEQIVVF